MKRIVRDHQKARKRESIVKIVKNAGFTPEHKKNQDIYSMEGALIEAKTGKLT